MEQIFGKGVSKGVAAGPISFYRRPSGEIPRRSVTDSAAELVRFHDACETAKEQLAAAKDSRALDEARVKFLGKKGELTALLKGMNLEEGATAIERNGKIGGHNA